MALQLVHLLSFYFMQYIMTDKNPAQLPSYDQLPIDPKYPPKTAWGIWGEDDNYGTLNLLTEERVANV